MSQKELITRYEELSAKFHSVPTSVAFKRGNFTLTQNGSSPNTVDASTFSAMLQDLEWEVAKNETRRTSLPSGNSFGFLCWWTISQGQYKVSDLIEHAKESGIDTSVISALRGADLETAFAKATNLGVKGYPSIPDHPSQTARYLTRDVGDHQRAIVREVIDQDKKKVSTLQVAILSRFGPTINTTDRSLTLTLDHEVDKLVDSMQEDMDRRVGFIDDTRLRSLLLNWLTSVHRVAMRGTGGVYFIPGTNRQAEVLAMRKFINNSGVGKFSVVRLYSDDATTLDDFRQSAIEEVKNEMAEVNDKLNQYESSAGMNEGSRMYSSSTQVERMRELGKKVQALQDSLGETIGLVDAQYQVILRRAIKMQQDSTQNVQLHKPSGERITPHRGERKEVKRSSTTFGSGEKKSGTSLNRTKAHSL